PRHRRRRAGSAAARHRGGARDHPQALRLSPPAAGRAHTETADGPGRRVSPARPVGRWAGRSGVLGEQRVDAVLVVDLAPGDGRVEHAHAADLLADAHLVLVVVVEEVERAGGELVHLTGGEVLDLALTVGDEHGLDVVRVP